MRAFLNKAIWLLVHKPPWKKVLIWGPWIVILLVLAFYGIENWRGQRALNKALEFAKNKQFSLDWKDYNPPPIPNEENLTQSESFQELEFDEQFKTTLALMKTKKAAPEISSNPCRFSETKRPFSSHLKN